MTDAFALTDKGSRSKMEDYAVLAENFNNKPDWIFGAVFDGHGGDKIAKLASEKMPEIFLEKIKQNLPVKKVLQETYSQLSEIAKEEFIGSTALSFLLQGDKLHVANIGDSRLIIIYNGIIQQLTNDHTVANDSELKRIKKYSPKIYSRFIMKGLRGLSVTRAFGDQHFKDVGIIAEPDIYETTIAKGSIIVAGSDGIWSILSNKEVSDLTKGGMAEIIANNILKGILATPEEPFDNISIIVIT